MRQVHKVLIIAAVVWMALTITIQPVSAQAVTASDLISGVNALRQSQGLAPYTVDSFLMNFAQSHSDYMASIGTWTHTRADGSTAFSVGIKENVAMGTNMSVNYCIYTVWSDWVHWETMVGYQTGSVGAGVAFANGNVFYTLNVLPGNATYDDNVDTDEGTSAFLPQIAQNTPEYISQVITSTPDEDGIIFHTVQFGETLWSIAIAYNVTIDEILKNSGLPLGTTEVVEGQQLLIRPATEPSPTNTPTRTPDPGTPTPTQPRPTMTPFPTRTPMPTQTPTQPPSFVTRAFGQTRYVAMGLILVNGLGILLVIYLGFLKKS